MSAREALGRHWPEYLMEAALLGAFMLSAAAFGTLLEHPDGPGRRAVENADLRRALMGVAMGLTSIALVHSPWGQQSGAHMNPAVTVTFHRLGRVPGWDAGFYVAAQFAGAIAGMLIATAAIGMWLAAPEVRWVVTAPGRFGVVAALLAEIAISAVLMTVVLQLTNRPRMARWTGAVVGVLVALYITFESPISGMSMNPARTVGSAFAAGDWTALWIYFVGPPLGMLLAAAVYVAPRSRRVFCAKLDHQNARRCIFCEARRPA